MPASDIEIPNWAFETFSMDQTFSTWQFAPQIAPQFDAPADDIATGMVAPDIELLLSSFENAEQQFVFASPENDVLTGSAADEIFVAYGGDDVVVGGNGNDMLSGGDGADMLFGDSEVDVSALLGSLGL